MAAIYYKQASGRDQNYQISGDDQFIVHNFEEYRAYRDIVFWWKCFHAASHPSSSASSTDSTGRSTGTHRYCQCSDETIFPDWQYFRHGGAPSFQFRDAQLSWQLKSEDQLYRNRQQGPAFQVKALGKSPEAVLQHGAAIVQRLDHSHDEVREAAP